MFFCLNCEFISFWSPLSALTPRGIQVAHAAKRWKKCVASAFRVRLRVHESSTIFMLQDSVLCAFSLPSCTSLHAHICRSARNFPPVVDTNGLLPCTIGVPFFSPLLQTPSALTLVLPPSVFEIPSVSSQNLYDHMRRRQTTPKYYSCCDIALWVP